MLLKNIFVATFTVVGLATAIPVEDIEARANTGTCLKSTNAWCCTTAFPFSIFSVRAVGSDCVPATRVPNTNDYKCPTTGRQNFLCCATNQLKSSNGKDIVCTA